jgi:hypothetical protein
MEAKTREWLRNLEPLGVEAGYLVSHGYSPKSAATEMANKACEPRDQIDFTQLCSDLNIQARRGGPAKGFDAEVEIYVFAYYTFLAYVGTIQAA